MTLGAELLAVLPEMRAAAESRMVDTCRVRASDAQTVWNETSQSYDEIPAVFSYEGPCLIKYGATQPRRLDAVGKAFIEQQVELQLPVLSSTAVAPGHVVVMLSAATDPGLVGREFHISGTFAQTYATSRRFPISEVTGE